MPFGFRRTPKVAKLKKRGDLEGLREAARYERLVPDRDGGVVDLSATVRIEALDALAGFYGSDVEQTVGEALSDRDAEVRRAAAEGLETIGSSRARELLVDHLTGPTAAADPVQREQIAHILTRVPLEGQAARWAVGVGDRGLRKLDEAAYTDFRALLDHDPGQGAAERVFRDAMPRVNGLATEADAVERYSTIMRWCRPLRIAGLAGLLQQPTVPGPVIRLAGMTGDQALVGPLAHLATRADAEVRRLAVEALGALRDTSAVVPLLRATRDEDYDVRTAALAGIDGLGTAGLTVAVTMLSQAALEQRVAAGGTALDGGGDGWTEQMLGRLLTEASEQASGAGGADTVRGLSTASDRD